MALNLIYCIWNGGGGGETRGEVYLWFHWLTLSYFKMSIKDNKEEIGEHTKKMLITGPLINFKKRVCPSSFPSSLKTFWCFLTLVLLQRNFTTLDPSFCFPMVFLWEILRLVGRSRVSVSEFVFNDHLLVKSLCNHLTMKTSKYICIIINVLLFFHCCLTTQESSKFLLVLNSNLRSVASCFIISSVMD